MIKRMPALLLSLALALPAAIPLPAAAPAIGPARPAGTASGVAWLLARQDAGGAWANLAGLTARDTAAAVEALAALGQTGGLEQGAAWLARTLFISPRALSPISLALSTIADRVASRSCACLLYTSPSPRD